jgi:cytochrome P450
MEPTIRQIATTILDRLTDRPTCDFVSDVSSQLPLAVICALMGIEEQHWPLMFQLTNRTLGERDIRDKTGLGERMVRYHLQGLTADELERRDRNPGPLLLLIERPISAGRNTSDVYVLRRPVGCLRRCAAISRS